MGKGQNRGPRRFLIALAVDAEAADRPGSPSGHPDGARARARIVDLFTKELGYVLVRVPEPTADREGLMGRLIRSTRAWDRRPDDIVAVHLCGPGGVSGDSPRRHVFFTADEVPGRRRPAISTAQILDALVKGAGIERLLLLADTFASDASSCDATALSAATERLSRDLGHPDGLAVIGALQPAGRAVGAGFAELLAAAVHARSVAGTRPSALDSRAVLAHIEADPKRSPALRLAWAGGSGSLPAFVPNPRRAPGGGAADAEVRPPSSIGADRAESADRVVSEPKSPDPGSPEPGSAGAGLRAPESVERADALRDLIRPLLHAQGRGLPWEDIWPELASRLAGHRYTDAEIAELIDRPPGEHVRIVETTAAERSFYRVDFPTAGGPVPAYDDEDVDAVRVHTVFVRTLVSRVPYRSDGSRDWARAHPYTLRHLATHARKAGLLDEIVVDAEYLVHAHPSILIPHLPTVRTPAARVAAAVYRTSIGVHRTAGPTTRRRILALDALCLDAAPLAAALVAGIAPDVWKPLAATGGPVSPAARDTIGGHTGSVEAVVCATLDGRPVAVTAAWWDETVRVWDLATGRSVGAPITHEALTGKSHRTNALACTTLDGRVVVVGGSLDTAVRMWDLRTGGLVREPFVGHEDSVTAVACTVLDGRPVAVTGSADRTVRVWDLATGRPFGRPLTGSTGGIRALACAIVDGRPVVVTASDYPDHSVRLLDLADGRSIGTLPGAESSLVSALACTTVDGRPLLVTGSYDRHVRIWDLTTRSLLGKPLAGHVGWVSAVTCASLGDRAVAVTGSADNTVRVWDLVARRAVGEPLTGHVDKVGAVACAVLDGRLLAVTGSEDHTVRVWDTDVEHDVAPRAGHRDVVHAMACTVVDGRPAVVTASADKTVRVWDTATCRPVGEPITEHLEIRTVASAVVDGRPVVALGAKCHDVCVWDPAGGEPVGLPTEGFAGSLTWAMACTVVNDRPVAVTVDYDGPVRIRDLTTGRPVGEPMTGHTERVAAVACTTLRGRPVAVTGSSDETVRVWDLEGGHPVGEPLVGHHWSVCAVACVLLDDRPVAVSAGYDDGLLLWDLTTGRSLGEPLIGHTGTVTALTCAILDGRPIALSGSDDGTARVWDLIRRECVDVLHLPGRCQSVAVDAHGNLVCAFGNDIAVFARSPNGS